MKYVLNYENKIKARLEKDDLCYKYYTETFGCMLNANDSMKYEAILESMGFTKTNIATEAMVILFNTCAIRENAEKKLFGRLGQVKKVKVNNKKACICVVGCMTAQIHIKEKIHTSYPYVDIVLGTNEMQCFAQSIYQVLFTPKEQRYLEKNMDEQIVENIPIKYENGNEAMISIIYGCNNFCSYCIVPYVRGRERSRKPQDILDEVKKLVKQGVTEITLLGQNVNSYGNDFDNDLKGYNFVALLKELENISGIICIKYMSPHPKDFSDELIEYIATSQKVSKQIHLPLQSGSTNILKAMNRKYTKEQYLELVGKIKKKIKGVSFSTDIIVGFPNETQKDFLDTLDVVQKVKFNMIYMFCYSKRKGTAAYNMVGQIDEKVKVERLEKLKKVYEDILEKLNDERVNKIEEIYVIGYSKNDKSKLEGRTFDNKVVIIDKNDSLIGKHIMVKIVENNKWFLTGKVENNSIVLKYEKF